MNVENFELYSSYDDALNKLTKEGHTEEEAKAKLMPLSFAQYNQLSGMNRAERRAWAKKNRKKKGGGVC